LNGVDAFRIIDKDFDGIISKEDLRYFLSENLQIKDMSSSGIDRLFKLLDKFKKKSINVQDF
jgi:Ca2+-binding EF-hand superfamily protein